MDVAQAKGPYQDSIEATSGSSPRSGGKTAMLRKYSAGSSCDTDNASAPFTACRPNNNSLGDILLEAITSRRLIPCCIPIIEHVCYDSITIHDEPRRASTLTSPRLIYLGSLPHLQIMSHGLRRFYTSSRIISLRFC